MKGIKAFNKDMTCNGYKFKENKTYKEKKAVICSCGFHFCTNPFDVLDYYNLCESEFANIEAVGKIDTKKNGDSKHTTTEIKIGIKIGLSGFIDSAINYLLNICNNGNKIKSGDSSQLASSGGSSKLASSGDYSKLASSGGSSQLASSGDYSKLAINGNHSVGANIGISGKAKGRKGCWITLAEWEYCNKENIHKPVCVKSVKIDGVKIKEDVFYILKNKKFTEFEAQ